MSGDGGDESNLAMIDVSKAAMQFNCVICLSDPIDSHLCPKCATFFCRACLAMAYQRSRCCPHCLSNESLESFVRVPVIANFMKSLRTAKSASVADKCSLHPAKVISAFCNDCLKPACNTCWTNDHLDHRVGPIESAYETVRKELKSSIEKFEYKIRSGLRTDRQNDFKRLKREGDQRVEELISSIRSAWDEACRIESNRIRNFDDSLRELKSTYKSLQDTAKDTLVEEFYFQNFKAELTEGIGENHSALVSRESPLDVNEVLSRWLPGWDVEERVQAEGLKAFFSPFSRRFSHDGDDWISESFRYYDFVWNVRIGPRRRNDDGSNDEHSSFASIADADWRKELAISVYMKEGGYLHDYEFRIEKITADAPRTVLTSTIVQRESLYDGGRIFFPLEDPVSWFDGEESMSFDFKLRPLTYQRQLEDFEDHRDQAVRGLTVFCKKNLRELAAKRQASGGGGSASGDESSLEKFKDELMEKLSDLRDSSV